MAEAESAEASPPTFKRRKVMRKPNHEDDSPGTDTTITKPGEEHEQNGAVLVTRVQKRGGGRKLGIGFSSSDTGKDVRDQQPEEQALAVASKDEVSEVPQNDRFVRPTGRIGVVTEDKHMMAYVDSKLAEIRPAAASPARQIKENVISESPPARDDPEIPDDAENSVQPVVATQTRPGDTTYQIAQERSRRVYQRPTKRKPRASRPQTDVARDSMIDQIMGENQVPHYDQTIPQMQDEDNDGVDNDAAAEETFKAQMLADLERNAKRRPPRITQATGASTGPKLGGSRAQREKMRALEEAKGSSGGVKK